MIVRFGLACVTAVLLGLLSAFAVACGGDENDQRLLAESRAASLKDDLDKIDEFVQDGRCDAARDRLTSLRARVGGLPRDTDPGLRDRLEAGVAHLEEIAPDECVDNKTDTVETTEEIPETVPETTPPETTETVPPPETTPETTPTQPQQTTPQETPPGQQDDGTPGNSGGAQAPGAGVVTPEGGD